MLVKVTGGFLEVEVQGQPPGQPPQIWGPTDPRPGYGLPGAQPHPEHPIHYPPQIWGPNDPRPGYGLPEGPGKPPGTWGGAGEPFPGYGLPEPPPGFPNPPADGAVKPPPPGGGWGYSTQYGWGYFPKPTEPSPKKV